MLDEKALTGADDFSDNRDLAESREIRQEFLRTIPP